MSLDLIHALRTYAHNMETCRLAELLTDAADKIEEQERALAIIARHNRVLGEKLDLLERLVQDNRHENVARRDSRLHADDIRTPP